MITATTKVDSALHLTLALLTRRYKLVIRLFVTSSPRLRVGRDKTWARMFKVAMACSSATRLKTWLTTSQMFHLEEMRARRGNNSFSFRTDGSRCINSSTAWLRFYLGFCHGPSIGPSQSLVACKCPCFHAGASSVFISLLASTANYCAALGTLLFAVGRRVLKWKATRLM